MKENHAKHKLAQGQVVTAITVNPIHDALAEQAAILGFDCVVADGEHGAVNDEHLESMARAADLGGVSCAIRLPSAMPIVASLRRYLEMGISTVQITQIQSADQAREVIEAVKYPPLGKRGVGPNARALEFGQIMAKGRMQDYVEFANRETMVIVSIEDEAGLTALPEVLKVDGIDIVMPGQVDLSSVFGIPGQTQHPKVLKALDEIGNQTIKAGKVLGRGADTPEAAELVIAAGARFILTSVSKAFSLGASPLLAGVNAARV
ncbi:MAG TPA: aldolase/citrate lyase family protein [Candidatus Dormibacteraeota bacterium]|jgi:4-hydroxy-2-oxoheptanedioate aldolase|nr:aldolase/citrate lyase family protein [Candidatus Dormibacteraeota bacterium]